MYYYFVFCYKSVVLEDFNIMLNILIGRGGMANYTLLKRILLSFSSVKSAKKMILSCHVS